MLIAALNGDSEYTEIIVPSKIQIANRTKSLTPDDIKMLNQRKRLEDGKIKGHGIGMELCAEIIDAHGWRLEYTLDKEKLRTIVYLV